MAVKEATLIGPYEILANLGAGGMGEVFRAWDHRLQREVAIKVIKNSGGDPEWQRRFLQEARAAGGLNHPNILTIHDVGVQDGWPYLVTELIDGESLRDVIRKKRLPLQKALDIAIQLLDGLAAAHRAGIVHRDLKPANIMVTKAGLVKILDFGLAKQMNASAGERAELTEPGLIIGTATYMSPEQARGEQVDIRSDQFSVGLILYEMLAGTPAFDRGSAVQTMAAIVSEGCRPLSALNPDLPAPLVWVIERCLSKDRELRYGSTFDLYYDVKTLDTRVGGLPAGKPSGAAKSSVRVFVLGLALICVVLAGVSTAFLKQMGNLVDFRQYRLTPLATSGLYEGEPAWSPDGKNIAFTGDVGHVRQVFARNLSAHQAAQLTRSRQDCSQPFWSADGSRIFYLAPDDSGSSALWSVGASGGGPQCLRRNVSAASVGPNGALAYLAPEAGDGLSLWLAKGAQSEGGRYAHAQWPHRSFSSGYLAFSPDGKSIGVWLASWSGSSEFWIVPYPAGRPRRAFTFEDGVYPFHWMPDGKRILFGGILPGTIGSDLHLADVNSGAFLPITKTTADARQPAVSADSAHIAFTVSERNWSLFRLSLSDPTLKPLVTSSLDNFGPAWSPAGSQLSFVTDRSGVPQIWLKSLADGWERPLVAPKDLGHSWISGFSDLSFSPDGQRLAFAASRAGTHAVYLFNAAGGPLVTLADGAADQRSPSWSPDGNSLAFGWNANGHWWLATASSGGNSKPALIRSFPSVHDVRWSPAGNLIACNTRDALYLVSPDGRDMKTIANMQWITFDWNRDGTGLIGILRHADGARVLSSLDIATGSVREIAHLDLPSIAEIGRISVSPQTQEVAIAISKPRGDIWMLDGFPRPLNVFEKIREVLNPLPAAK